MKGDYHRYMAEFKVGDEPKEAAEDTTNSYKAAQVREGRMPGKTTELENLEANIAEVLLMVQVSSAGFDGVVNDKLEKMARAFAVGAYSNSPPLPLTSLLVQDHKGISNVAPADAPLRSLSIPKVESETGLQEANDVGEARIHDYISNLQFRMSPTAFFQVNTLAAEKSYSLVGDWAGLGPDTLLFDICCGIGTIGLTLAHRVGTAKDVTGSLLKEYLNLPQKQDEIPNSYDTNDEEVTATDATDPEESSGVEPKNSEGASECSRNGGQESHVQQSCTSENGTNIKFKNVVAIVDPPRVDFIPLYISCNPESLVANAIEL